MTLKERINALEARIKALEEEIGTAEKEYYVVGDDVDASTTGTETEENIALWF